MMAYARADRPPGEAQILGLPETDKQALSMVFGGVESMLFLGSNFGAMLERLAQLPPRERWKKGDPDRHTYRDIEPEVMSVKASHGIRVSQEPSKLEAWACWTNHEVDADGYRVEEARDALVWLVDHGRTWAVTVLHKLYGGILPALESSQLAFLGELAPLALDTPTVLDRAAALTKKLRAGLGADRIPARKGKRKQDLLEQWTPHPGKYKDRAETVTPRSALEELLVSVNQELRKGAIRDEALQLSIRASSAYMRAKASC